MSLSLSGSIRFCILSEYVNPWKILLLHDVTMSMAREAANQKVIIQEYCGILWQSLFKGIFFRLTLWRILYNFNE